MPSRAFVCLALVLSIAAPSLVANTPSKKAPHGKKVLRGSGSDFLFDMSLSLVKSIAGAAVSHSLFPHKTMDVEKLLADMTASMRTELIKNVLDGDDAALTAATTLLHDYETEWKTDGDGEKYEARVNSDSTINAANLVIARTGPSGKKEYVMRGVALYIAAAQIKANRLQLRRRMLNRPEERDAVRPVLIEHLETSLRHARQTIDYVREEAINTRLSAVNQCNIYDRRRHWDNVTLYTRCHDYDRQVCSQQAENDESMALARCDGQRDRYVEGIRRSKAAEVDKGYVEMLAILDQWAQALDGLKKAPPASSARVARMDFGGMFGIGERAFNNPLTGTTSCPEGFAQYEFKGTRDIDWPAYYCGRIGMLLQPIADFGGMFGVTDDRNTTYWNTNPITNSDSCPAGFQKVQVNNQHLLYFCWRSHTPGSRSEYLFGGIYSDNGEKKNPMTNTMGCPNGFMPALAHGTRPSSNVPGTQRTIFCWTKEP